MKTIHLLIICGTVLAISSVGYSIEGRLNNIKALNAMAPARMAAGNAEIKLTDVSTSKNSALTANKVYCMVCDATAGAVFYEFGDGSGPTADTSGRYLPASAEKCFRAGASGDSDYIGVLSEAAGAGNCYLSMSE